MAFGMLSVGSCLAWYFCSAPQLEPIVIMSTIITTAGTFLANLICDMLRIPYE